MAVTIPVIPRQNSTANNPPTTTAVKVGELAVNVVDGTLWTNYTPAGAGTTQTILQLGGKGFLTTAVAATTYAPIASPTFTGTATIPTATISGGTINSASIGATTASTGSFTTLNASGTSTLAGLTSTGINSSPIGATTASTGAFTNLSATGTSSFVSPSLTGTPTAPTATAGTNTTQIATTAFVNSAGYLTSSGASSTYAPLASPTLTGTPVAPTATTGTNTTQIATTAFVNSAGYLTSSSAASTYAPIASPTITGLASFTSGIAIGSTTTSSAVSLTLSTTSAVNRQIFWQTGGNNRWGWATDTSSESGSNAGCNFYLSNYADNGSFLSNAIGVIRSTGNVNITLASIYSGTIDNTVIGGSTPSSGTFSSLKANSSLTASSGIIRPVTTFAAAGTTLATATALTAFYNEITSGTGGVTLPSSSTGFNAVGIDIFVMNRSGSSITVYPDVSGNTIESGSSGAGVILPNLADARFTKIASTNWLSTGGDNGYYTALNANSIGAQTPGTGAFTNLSATGTTSLASPSLTGTPTAPTATVGTNTTQIATTAFVNSAGYLTSSSASSTYAPIASPTFTGVATFPAVNVTTTTASSSILLSANAAVGRQVIWQTSSTNRWIWASDTSSESGSNAGCNLFLSAYSDSGSFLSNAIQVYRSSGLVAIPVVQLLSGNIDSTIIGGTTPSTGRFTTLTTTGILTTSNGLIRTLVTLAAAGTTLATGTALANYYNEVTSGTGGVVLPLSTTGYNQVGSEVWIFNRSGSAITIYPDTSSNTIELASAGTGVVCPNGGDVRFTKVSSTNWISSGNDSGFFNQLTVNGSSTLGSVTSTGINSSPIGATTASTGAFTTLTTNGLLTTLNGIIRTLSIIAAAGTTLATGTALTSYYNEVTSGTGGVVLPQVATGYNQAGSEVWVFNRSGVSITVYPDTSSATIENAAAGTGVVCPNGGDVRFTKITTTNWISSGNDSGFFNTLSVSGQSTLTGLTATGITSSPISGSTGSFTTLASSGLSTLNSLTVSTTSTFTGIQTLTVAPVLTSTTASTVLSSNASKQLVSTTLSNGLVAGSGTLTFNVATMFPPINATITATTYTLATTDNNSTKVFNPTAACVITVPSTLTAGFTCNVWNKSNYKITWTPASGVTIAVYPSTATGTAGQNAVMTFYCDTSTDWVVGGAVS